MASYHSLDHSVDVGPSDVTVYGEENKRAGLLRMVGAGMMLASATVLVLDATPLGEQSAKLYVTPSMNGIAPRSATEVGVARPGISAPGSAGASADATAAKPAFGVSSVVSMAALVGGAALVALNRPSKQARHAMALFGLFKKKADKTAEASGAVGITKEQVIAAQEQWGNGIVAISKAHKEGGDYVGMARKHIETLYGYDQGPVLFKPTLAAESQFRSSFGEAFSYFVATNKMCAEDTGFAIKGWTNVRWQNVDIVTYGTTAMAMGNYFFTTPTGDEVKVEYTFGYFLDKQGKVRINLHHSSVPYSATSSATITKEQVLAAQEQWGNGIVAISKAHKDGGDYEQMAREHIQTLYGYDQGPVLFKPTLASQEQFRSSFGEAFSYFVATNKMCPEDGGFAIKGWTNVRWQNVNIITQGSTAVAMGNYYFTTPAGDEVKVEYTFGYFLDAEGKVRINLHHSSVPYSAGESSSSKDTLTKEMITEAQKTWGNGIVNISKVHKEGGDYESAARDHIQNLYGYGQGPVLFKPTLAKDVQFRSSFPEAFSYFVATNKLCGEDTGFAIKGWKNVRWENVDIITQGSTGVAMGNYFFTTPEDTEVKVEYTFGYFLDAEGKVRINLHHSSVPYAG